MKLIKKEVTGWSVFAYFILILIVLAFIGSGIVKAVESFKDADFFDGEKVVLNASQDELVKGKNFVKFDRYIEVRELAVRNRWIDAVSYYDSFLDKSVGYVNIFGGIGRDFMIVPGYEYEISVKSNGKLTLN